MRYAVLKGLGAAVALGLAVAGCGSSSSGGSGGSGSTITVGVVSSLTGAVGSSFSTVEKGVQARFNAQNAQGGVNGHKLAYVMGDDQSTTQGALTATKSLVESKHVFGILEVSAYFYSAVPFTKQQKIPVVGSGFDGTEWVDPSNTNLFSTDGSESYSKSSTTLGLFFKGQGVTKLASVGNTGTPSSAGAAVGAKLSAQSQGIPTPYLNTNVPLGSTDVGAIAIGIKNSGADGLYVPSTPQTAFALIGALDQLGVHMKAIVLATGYGGDLLQEPQAVQVAQGVDFPVPFAPLESGTAASKQMAADFAKVGVTGDPTFAEQFGYLTADTFIRGLQAAGANPTQASFISGLRGVSDYTAGGLYPKPVDFSAFGTLSGGTGPGNCDYFVVLKGNAFQAVPNANPLCGELIPGASTGY